MSDAPIPMHITRSRFRCRLRPAKKPYIVFVTGDHEYSSEATMPKIAAELEKNYGFRTKVLKAYPDQNAEENIPGLEALREADVVVRPALQGVGSADFNARKRSIAAGRAAMQLRLPELKLALEARAR